MTTLANRYAHLGTETAFAVSAEAAAFSARGNKVYPFHLGDMNLPTPQNIVSAMTEAIKNGKTGYCPNGGIPQLREAVAHDINRNHGTSYTMDNVSIQPGGKPVINKFLLALMNPGDEVLYPNPGYPIYESLIRFYGGKPVPYGYTEGEKNFEIDVNALEKLISPKTTILILNDLQNPTGAEAKEQELADIAGLVRKHNLYVLSDEAYFEIRYGGKSRSIVTFPDMDQRCVILFTFSKKYAMTGWRIGAAIGPKDIAGAITRFNVNDESCTNHFVQYAAIEALKGPQEEPKRILEVLKDRRDTAVEILNSIEGVHCFNPNATFYLYPNVTEAMKRNAMADYEELRKGVLENTGVSFCTRLHFGSPLPNEKDSYIRLAYSGISKEMIVEGLTRLKEFLE